MNVYCLVKSLRNAVDEATPQHANL
jgi:hypothetical protein